MWQIPQGLDLRSAPKCHCQLKTKLYTSLTHKNYQLALCRGRDQQCSNGFRVKETCKECGKVLIDETTDTGKVH